MFDVVVVGGGLSGLAVAHRIHSRDSAAKIVVLESTSRTGGILGTIERDDCIIETGPDSILREKQAAMELATELSIAHRTIETDDRNRGALVVHRGQLHKIPEGFSLMAPTQLKPWLSTELMSWPGKLRAAAEVLVPRGKQEDESLASFVRRRFGEELLERLAQPMIGGIYGGDPEKISLRATMPRFVEMERNGGSVIREMLKKRRGGDRNASGARYALFFAFDRGMKVLTDALHDRLPEVRVDSAVEALSRSGGTWTIRVRGGEVLRSSRVVLALPAWRAGALLDHGELGEELEGIAYGSAATVTLVYRRSDIEHPLDAFGFVVPTAERRSVLAATFSSVKWPGRAPDDKALIRVFVGGQNALDASEWEEETLIGLARSELTQLLGVRSAPKLSLVVRYARAMPQYHVGHLARVDRIEALTAEEPGLALAGNAYRGVGIPDSIAYARAVADRVLAT